MAVPTPYSTKMNLSDLCLHLPHCLQQHQQHDQQHHRCDYGNQAAHNKNVSSTPFQLHPQRLPVHHPSHYQKQSRHQLHPLKQTNVQHQHQQQQQHQQQRRQQHQDYRCNSRASGRCATTTPTPSTSSDNCSDSEGIRGGLMGSPAAGPNCTARSKNPDQVAKNRPRSVDNDTETSIELSQLFISATSSTTNTSPTLSVPTTTTTATDAVAAAPAAKTVLGGTHQDDISRYYFYYPPGWTATLISPGVGGGGRAKSRAYGPRPSWPPSRRINSVYYYP